MKISKAEKILLNFLSAPCGGDCPRCNVINECFQICSYLEERGLWNGKPVYKESDLEVIENE